MSAKIYLICLNGEPKYVGYTEQTLQERWKQHVASARSRRKKTDENRIILNAIRKYGENAFTIELIAEYLDTNFALDVCETFWIKTLGTHYSLGDGYNMTWGGEAVMSNRKHSEATKAQLRANNLAQGNPFYGHVHSDATKKIIGEKGKGRPAWNKGLRTPDDVRQKQSQAKLGKKQSLETCRKKSETRKRIMTDEMRANASLKQKAYRAKIKEQI
jgi:group I intron endonuclease